MLLHFSLPLIVCLLAVLGSPAQEPNDNAKLAQLTLGETAARKLAAGGKERLEISLPADKVLRLSLDKGDMALELALYDPAEQKVIGQVSHAYEVLDIHLSTHAAGTYRLEITSLEREADRQYQVKIETVRTATTDDQKINAAQESVARSSFLRADWTERSLRHAVEQYDVAAKIRRSLRDFRGAAAASMGAGEVCIILGEYREALKRYQTVAENAGGRLEEAEALSRIGLLHSYLGNNDEAQQNLTRSLEFLSESGNGVQTANVKQAYGEALSNLGEVNYSKGDLVKSLADFERALKLFVEVGDRRGEARVRFFKGLIAGSLGDAKKGVTEISQALAMYQAVGDKTGEGLCLTSIAIADSSNRKAEALTKLREAKDIFRAIGDRQSEGIAINGLGQAYGFLGQHQTALDHYLQALRVFEESGALDFASISMFKVAQTYQALDNVEQALSYYELCLRLSRKAKKSRTEAMALNAVAKLYAKQRNREKTIAQYRRILKFYEGISDRRGQATALNNLGDFLLQVGSRKEALSAYEQALPLSEQSGDKDVLILTLYDIARANRDLGALDDSLSYIQRSIKIIEELRNNVVTPDFRTTYFAVVRQHYDLLIDILMQLDHERPEEGFAARALLASENSRARSLIDMLTEAGADIRRDAAPALLERERELQGLLRAQARYQMALSTGGKSQPETVEAARQIDQLRAEYQEIEAQLRDQNPRLLKLKQPPSLSLEKVQSELRDENSILLEYSLGDERSYLWAVTSTSLHSYELPSRATLEAAGREVYKLLTARQATAGGVADRYQVNVEASDKAYRDKALELSRILLGPVAGQLGGKRIIVVTEGVLQYIPFDALPLPAPIAGSNSAQSSVSDDPSPVITTNEIVTLPSFSTLAAIRQEKRTARSGSKLVAVLADPVFSSDDDRVQNSKQRPALASAAADHNSTQPFLRDFASSGNDGPMRLLHASEEADAILAATPRGAGMVARGFDASRETAMSTLVSEYKIVHFATHGFLNGEHPELSGIVLTMVNPDGSETNGFMPLRDIYNLNLSADLVVLSACDTALGKDIKGEGLVGLTHGFMAAGSKSVVASLWKVDDRATAVLMANFYKAMLEEGLTPAAALRVAKQKVRQEKAWQAPYFWAGFVLQGEYNERIVVDGQSWLRPAVVTVLILLLISFSLTVLQRRRRRSILSNSR